MRAKVLIIEDEVELGELVQLYLSKDGIDSDIAVSAEAGFEYMAKHAYDLITLDINLPGMDGFEFLQKFRQSSDIPVLILSAREGDEDIVLGLGLGADEFVNKPFAPKVLVARIRAILRRVRSDQDNTPTKKIIFGNFILSTEGYHLEKNGERIVLSTKEFEVLRYLVQNPGTAFSPDEIYQSVWGREFGDISTVGVYIQRIRKKIETDFSNPEYILTIHGRGYLFDERKLIDES
ncbi:MAG: response regulator transcription factor [Spirochaetales bacterium]|nr:response regulator transcription factor [Spirochaetales bacterium]